MRYLVVTCLALAMGGLGGVPLAPAALAAAPASLMGETLNGDGSISATCTSPDNGSFTFSASGPTSISGATGPYPGTFTESGNFTITNSTLTAFSATFTITSAAGSVSGSKSLAAETAAPLCRSDIGAFTAAVTYTATINSAYRDTGTATVALQQLSQVQLFDELFTTSNGVVPLCQDNQNKQGNQSNQRTGGGNCNSR
jgi:hypothetical protein